MREEEKRKAVSIFRFIDSSDRSVMEVDAENTYLEKLLDKRVEYIPAAGRTGLLEREDSDGIVDVVVCSQTLESKKTPKIFLDKVTGICKKVILFCKERKEIIEYMRGRGFCVTRWKVMGADSRMLILCFEKMMPENLAANSFCTGCGACANTCPADAVSMRFDAQGFLKPHVDMERCIHCNQCTAVCPSINKSNIAKQAEPDCYAAWADDKTRGISSSGGVFSVLAKYILDTGGYVFGAAWSQDFFCHHISVDSVDDLHKLRYSKYVQSNTEKTFREVRKRLEEKKSVLYVGCPCQIAGLKAYLGEQKQSPLLFMVDVICFCAPSAVDFRKYLEEQFGIDKVYNVSFRHKVRGWSPTGYKIELKNGKNLYPVMEEDAYQQAFHGGLARNDVCENCEYTGFPRQGDWSIGDFWCIDMHDKSWNDGKGTSMIWINTAKGEEVLTAVENDFARIEKVPGYWALNKGNRISDDGRKRNKNYEFFRRLQSRTTFSEAVQAAFINFHDIGLVCCINNNIGNNITNYALYQYLTDCNKTVKMIDCAMDAPYYLAENKKEMFLENPYLKEDRTEDYSQNIDMLDLNEKCGCFVLGSDQLLRKSFIEGTRYHTCMDWVSSDKYKAAYATSFGVDKFEGSSHVRAKVKFLLERFQRIAVREASGVELLNNEFGIKGDAVLDPVFLCDKRYYDSMSEIGRIRMPDQPFIGGYILDVTSEKESMIYRLCGEKHMDHLVILNAETHYDGQYEGSMNVLPFPAVEEWLALIKNCEFFVTDSFHGICFAIIFQKQFYVTFDRGNWRGWTRMEDLLKMLGLEDRLVDRLEDLSEKDFGRDKIDYSIIDNILEDKRIISRSWLENMMKEAEVFRAGYTEYDFLQERYREAKEDYRHLEQKNREIRSDTFMYAARRFDGISISKEGRRTMEIIGWGAGDCFYRNYNTIKQFYNLKYVCDSDPEKWGGKLVEDVQCISPGQLKGMTGVMVIIMVDSMTVAFDIAKKLLDLGIVNFDCVQNWLNYVEGNGRA